MDKKFTFKERVLNLMALFMIGLLGGGVAFYLLYANISRNTVFNTEKITERQVYIENSATISTVQKVSASLVTFLDKKSADSLSRRDGAIEMDCFRFQDSCRKVGAVLTSDGLVISAFDLPESDLANWVALDIQGEKYQIAGVGKVGEAKIYQLVKNGELALPDAQRMKFFNLLPVMLADATQVSVGQGIIVVQTALEGNLKVGQGNVSGIAEKSGVVRIIDASYKPVDLAVTDMNAGLVFDLNGGLLTVLPDRTDVKVGAVEIEAFLKRYASSNKNFAAVSLGVSCINLDNQLALKLGYKVDYGCLVAKGLTENGQLNSEGAVEKNSLAEKAGLKAGDVILEVDNNSLLKADLGTLMLDKVAGEKVDFLVLREGKTTDLTVTL